MDDIKFSLWRFKMNRLHAVIPLLAILCFTWACGGESGTETGENLAIPLEESVDKIVTLKGKAGICAHCYDNFYVFYFEGKGDLRFYVIAEEDEIQQQNNYKITGKLTVVEGELEGTSVSFSEKAYIFEDPDSIEHWN
jgi:hypothetical protein